MPVHSRLYETLPEGFGYVVLTGMGSVFVNIYLAINVARARKQYDVKYPALYSKDNDKFNCIQRAHQHTLENYPQFLFMLTFSGLQYPQISAGAGAVYLVSRIAYAHGYYTGDPAKRQWGSFGMLGSIVLLGGAISFAAHQLKWV